MTEGPDLISGILEARDAAHHAEQQHEYQDNRRQRHIPYAVVAGPTEPVTPARSKTMVTGCFSKQYPSTADQMRG